MTRCASFSALLVLALVACAHSPREVARLVTGAPAPVATRTPAPVPDGDRDGDGFKDSLDRCPDDRGDEPDGCPIPDSDADRILDVDDRCPQHPESYNGFQDDDGCPDVIPQMLSRYTGTVGGINFGGAAGRGVRVPGKPRPGVGPQASGERYGHVGDNPFVRVAADPLATFAADVDTAAYSNMRRFVRAGQLPPRDAVRTDELVNYFDYDYPQPTGDEVFAVRTEVGPCPWNPQHRLVHVGVQAKAIAAATIPPRNLVFLVDVSGSMSDADKLPLLKQALARLVDDLRPQDRVALVVYAGAAGVVLEPPAGADKDIIHAALGHLEAGGSTAGGQGIELAYALAQRHFQRDAVNRVLLATDGDFNVGVSDTASLTRLIADKRRTGIALTVLGFGKGNLNDALMESLADKGDGNYAYIDDLDEAHKVLVREAAATLVTVARDVKLQLAWNGERVAAYRQIGYDNRQLGDRDFKDDRKDAGDVGAGHAVTAIFEIVPAAAPRGGDLFTLKIRSQSPQGSPRPEQVVAVPDPGPRALADTSTDFRFSAAVAELGLVLRDAPARNYASYEQVLRLARDAVGADPHGDRKEFIGLVESLQSIAGRANARSAVDAAEWLRELAGDANAPATRAVRKARILPVSTIPSLERAAQVLQEYPSIRLEISGHSDDREGRTREELLAIARARAVAVAAYLVNVAGIDPQRLQVRVAGPDEPIDSNATATGRAHNRRVDFRVSAQ